RRLCSRRNTSARHLRQARRADRARRPPLDPGRLSAASRRYRDVPALRVAAGRSLPHLGRRRSDVAARRDARAVASGERRVTDAVSAAGDALGSLAQHGVAIGPLTTYRAGGHAALFVRAETGEDLVAVAEAVRVSGIDVLLVGKGSN